MATVKIEEKEEWLKIQIKSPKKIGGIILTAIVSTLLFMSIILAFFIPMNDIPSKFIGLLVIISFGYLLFLYLNTFFFLLKGYEELIISTTGNTLAFSRMGFTKFHRKTQRLEEVKHIGLSSNFQLLQNKTNLFSHMPFGYEGGPLEFKYKKKKSIEFGTALSASEAQEIDRKIQTFLQNHR